MKKTQGQIALEWGDFMRKNKGLPFRLPLREGQSGNPTENLKIHIQKHSRLINIENPLTEGFSYCQGVQIVSSYFWKYLESKPAKAFPCLASTFHAQKNVRIFSVSSMYNGVSLY